MSKYIDAEKLIAEINLLKRQLIRSACAAQIEMETNCKDEAYNEVLSLISSLQKERSEVDFEKFTDKIKTFQERYKYPEIVSIKGAMAFMTRMFYQYPNAARQWYDSLPKVTMD